jgi:hypothetical protein
LARGYELNAIAASVVGGCSLQGGLGTIPGTLLGALFLRVVIDGVSKIIKTGADVYEGLIVGVLVVFAVTFTTTSEAMSSTRRKLFSGPLGWVTIVNLTLLAGVMMALLGAKLLRGRVHMDAAWLASIAAAATLLLLLILRSEAAQLTKRNWGITWAVATIATAIGADMNYPQFQRGAAVAIARKAGGTVTQNDDGGIVVDLGSRCTDASLKRLLQRVRYFPNVTELRLNNTVITDSGLDAIGKAFQEAKSLKRLDVTGSKVSEIGIVKLKRTLTGLEVLP